MILNELLDQYEAQYLPHIIDYKRAKSCIRWLRELGHHQMETLTHQKLLEYREKRRKAGLKPASINKELGYLCSALKWGNRNGLTNVAVSIPREKEVPKNKHVADKDVHKLIAAAGDLKTKSYISLLYLTGQRKTAVQTLKRSQIKDGVIYFSHAATGNMKNRADIPITPQVKKILNDLKKQYGKTTYIFPDEEGIGYCKHLDWGFHKACLRAGVSITPHGLRHSIATNLIEKGVNLLEVSRFLGHKTVDITQHQYLHLSPSYVVAAAEKAAEGFGK